eukprot:CAMPEP_0172893048 /NCGR_PEP_ID=MMETSP1075-20121228/147607_1 /TAXON_ID=2916 /ORGANISM="Ceratium fusus, Strain PA161109" /LENGTH=460 /DNA_ID=CAMNT_0013747841 /DNA_START=149 /DNA_END=1531 /DNA_ORIENTATION=-
MAWVLVATLPFMLQAVGNSGGTSSKPYVMQLRRESVPVRRKGKAVSFKTSYSGLVHVGRPAQEFRVVFDTGSGNIVLPALECRSEACLAHRRYNMKASDTALGINLDGSGILPDELCDQVNIGFGTGHIVGEFVRERVCLGKAQSALAVGGSTVMPCIDMHVVMAVEMSRHPFKSFEFDGIVGLGLGSLALSANFSLFHWLSNSDAANGPAQFAVFLTPGEEGEQSEIAFGGFVPERTLEPITWAPVVLPNLGYWAVQVIAVRVGGIALDICNDGNCRGVVDTGSSHLGIPGPYDQHIAKLLTKAVDQHVDCRMADTPVLEIEVPGRNLTLFPSNYMRPMPLREDMHDVGSPKGVTMASRGGSQKSEKPNDSVQPRNLRAETLVRDVTPEKETNGTLRHYCRPKLMPVTLPEPLGPKMFILGELVLHRYYSVFDWRQQQVGFGLAANRQNRRGTKLQRDR